jgi:hypothetical protein
MIAEKTTAPAFAAKRPAAHLRTPELPRHIRWHVVDAVTSGGKQLACCGVGPLEQSAIQVPASKVPVAMRCLRPGCKARWNAVDG